MGWINTLLSFGLALPLISCVHSGQGEISQVIGTVDGPIKIPLQLDDAPVDGTTLSSYRLFGHCKLGEQSGLCLFDTGAQGLVVGTCFAKSKYKVDKRISNLGMSGTMRELSQVAFPTAEFGNVEFSDAHGVIAPGIDCNDYLGIVGYDFFQDEFFLDDQDSTLTEVNPGIALANQLRQVQGLLFIEVKVFGKKRLALVDTGAAMTIFSKELASERPTDLVQLPINSYQIDNIGDPVKIESVHQGHLTIDDVDVKDLSIAVANLEPLWKYFGRFDVILGMNAMQEFSWGFSLERNKWGILKR
jgi:hypothetical protein